MTSLITTQELNAKIKLCQEAGVDKILLDKKTGIVVITHRDKVILRGVKKPGGAWIVTFKDSDEVKWFS